MTQHAEPSAELFEQIETTIQKSASIPKSLVPTEQLRATFGAYVRAKLREQAQAELDALRRVVELRMVRDRTIERTTADLEQRALLLHALVDTVADAVPALSEPLLVESRRVHGQNAERHYEQKWRGFQVAGPLTINDDEPSVFARMLYMVHGPGQTRLSLVVYAGHNRGGIAEYRGTFVPVTSAAAIEVFGYRVVDEVLERLWKRMWSALEGHRATDERLIVAARRIEAALNALLAR